MELPDRFSIIEQLTKIEFKIASLEFPASGHLRLKQSLPEESRRVPLDPAIDPEGLYCIRAFI
jgi:hypothetical protein